MMRLMIHRVVRCLWSCLRAKRSPRGRVGFSSGMVWQKTPWLGRHLCASSMGLAAVLAIVLTSSMVHSPLEAASCCGGGSASPLLLPKFYRQMVQSQLSLERYDGYWNQKGQVKNDPPHSELEQWRWQWGYAKRLSSRWQASVQIPWVWNDNLYGRQKSSSQGLGDSTLNLVYEAFDGVQCLYRIRHWRDLTPASYFNLGLTLPTGISPYDDQKNSYDITGRGHYVLNASVLLEKSIFPWSARAQLGAGYPIERSVNREYGKAVAPYKVQLGTSWDVAIGFGYSMPVQTWGSLSFNLDAKRVQESESRYNGSKDPNTGYRKKNLSVSSSWSNVPKTRIATLGYHFSPRESSWGKNFPITQRLSFGVSYVIP